ncbi:MAG: IS66 family insertion sequence element accessory protein TnpB [Rubrivivax sp.]|nr:IS66 family insertion sequence element accessory protein TnpB [Rubrivivax sp.]
MDTRAGAERLRAAVVSTLGQARAHRGYLFANARATRLKLLAHDGLGIWCASRRLHAGRFVWLAARAGAAPALELTRAQFDALVLGLPWQRIERAARDLGLAQLHRAGLVHRVHRKHVLGEIDSNGQNGHGLPLPNESMEELHFPSWHSLPIAAAGLARDGEVPFIHYAPQHRGHSMIDSR